jgi:hypothetical protein
MLPTAPGCHPISGGICKAFRMLNALRANVVSLPARHLAYPLNHADPPQVFGQICRIYNTRHKLLIVNAFFERRYDICVCDGLLWRVFYGIGDG